jgi:multiple sugar transport system ATP-binding protein
VTASPSTGGAHGATPVERVGGQSAMNAVRFSGVSKVYAGGATAVDDLDLEIAGQELLVLVGPSGCGKTTALRMVAGLEDISAGEISVAGTVVNRLEPRKRDIAMVFQNYALYPHMTVFDNIAFPLRCRRVGRREIRERVERAARLLGLEDMLKRRPRTLSGGQRQRVAMGRAIVREPRVFLMDEPLSNLDAKLRTQMRTEIAQIQRELGVTTIYVTHDQVEAMTMGTRIAVMRKGVLQQQGSPQEVYDDPVNLFVASFIGSPAMNLVQATLERRNGGLACRIGEQRLDLPDRVIARVPALAGYEGRDVAVGIRPEHLRANDSAGPVASLVGDAVVVETLGAEKLVHVDMPGHAVVTEDVLEVARDTDASLAQALQRGERSDRVSLVARFEPDAPTTVGSSVRVPVALERLRFFDLQTGLALR